MSVIYLSCAWLAGIFLGAVFLDGEFHIPLALVFSGFIPLTLLLLFRQRSQPLILASLCLFALLGGAFYFQARSAGIEESLRYYNDNQETVVITGMVDRDPEPGGKTTHLYLSAENITDGEEWRDVSGTALLFVPVYPAYSYGDVLSVKGKLETPPRLDEFDYQGYLANQGIYSTMLYPKIGVVATGQGFPPLRWLYSLRNRLSQVLTQVLPEPQASLSQGIVLGIRGNIPPAVKADFARTGAAHLLAISGLHLGIVAVIMLSLGIRLFGKRRYIH
ncbi:MAG: ComEC/Rec2 family competence protein, partial [Dehalococcoidales bacterium]|nr:ComEC/Rec2 family competence protein [Dehalococcoidales bacterium]